MDIRPLTAGDKPKILHLLEQRGTFNKQEVEVAREVLEESLLHPEKNEYHVFCAVNGAENLTGYICFGPIPMTENCYEIYWIAVDKKYPRQAIGEKLLRAAEESMARKKARRIYLDTSSTPPYQPARSFYEKHGYRMVCMFEDFYRHGDHKMVYMKQIRDVEELHQ